MSRYSISRSQIRSSRSYSTAAGGSTKSSNTPLILLGLGAAGAGAFYYSTQGNASAAGDKAKNVHSGLQTSDLPSALDPKEWRNLKLKEVKPYNYNTARFIFDLPEGTSAALPVASALVVKAANKEDCMDEKNSAVIRPYTPTTSPGTEGHLVSLCLRIAAWPARLFWRDRASLFDS